MEQLEWTEALRVGVDLIDRQHQDFIKAINDLFGAVMEGDEQQIRIASIEALGRISTYMREHFSAEEDLMERIGYPDLEDHRALHQTFAQWVGTYIDGVSDGSLSLSGDLLQDMLVWLRDHLMEEDMKYAAHYRRQQKQKG